MEFTRVKFASLALDKQHKICAKLLNSIYRLQQEGKAFQTALTSYEAYAGWMGLSLLDLSSRSDLADRYHEHLRSAGVAAHEGCFLPSHFDKPSAEPLWPIHIYLDQLRSAHNVGSILRTVEGFSLGTVYFSKSTPWIDQKKVQDASCGACTLVKCIKVECIREVSLKDLPAPLIALETAEGSSPYHHFDFPESFTLAIGNEEYGCSKETLRAAQKVIHIPMRGRKNSLNVANAFAIVAAEIVRQRVDISV